MTQRERREFLIRSMLLERPEYGNVSIPTDDAGQQRLLRSLFNLRPPQPPSEAFLQIQDAYLRQEIAGKGVTDLNALRPVEEGIYLWRGDITTLRCDAIVNAANSGLLGCFYPCHGCIDNAIHTYAGVQLRLACAALMEQQGHEEETGKAKITPAFPPPRGLPTTASASTGISAIFKRNTAFTTCIPAAFTPIPPWKSIGPTGAGISGSTGTRTHPCPPTKTC